MWSQLCSTFLFAVNCKPNCGSENIVSCLTLIYLLISHIHLWICIYPDQRLSYPSVILLGWSITAAHSTTTFFSLTFQLEFLTCTLKPVIYLFWPLGGNAISTLTYYQHIYLFWYCKSASKLTYLHIQQLHNNIIIHLELCFRSLEKVKYPLFFLTQIWTLPP